MEPDPKIDVNETGGRTSSRHPFTSHEAGARVHVGSQTAAILVDMRGRIDGATAYELANDGEAIRAKRPNISTNQVGSRLGELRDRGLVAYGVDEEGDPITRPTKTGRAIVHRLTPAGRIEAGRLAARDG